MSTGSTVGASSSSGTARIKRDIVTARIAEARLLRASGLLYRQIADRLGVSTSTVGQWFSDPDGAKLRARKDGYRGVCNSCGGPTDGSNGRGPKASKRCSGCIEWSDAAIITAMQLWADAHGGRPPTCTSWRKAGADHPSAAIVTNRIGWNEALLRAGLPLSCDRRPETQLQIEQMIRDGHSALEVAIAVGSTDVNVRARLYSRGLSISTLRASA